MLMLTVTLHAQVNILLDTDIGSDCDDAGALAVLNKLADRGEAHMLGVIYSSGKNKYGIGVCDAINTYYGRGDLPLGQYKGNDIGDPADHYSKAIATAGAVYHHDVVDDAPELVETYKKILKRQPDSSVTLVTIGHPYGLVLLMRDAAAWRLVKRKIKKWVAMTGTSEKPNRDWNFGRNGAEYYIDTLLKHWPADAYFCTLGREVVTGNKKLPATPADNPVRKAYALWNDALSHGRYSWDQIAVLFAVRPQYFRVDSSGALEQNKALQTYWNPRGHNPKHHRVLAPVAGNSALADTIETLMSEAPSRPGK
ncbi:hypothetical protein GCM10023143_19050 [Compostibacter hankyongensis]|uniref:Nucleoside hydrolase n=2 Tax=Compostibacter hankyongensis TaxID=1007089 RepID=A0ABP8FT77_9BACT